MSKQHILLGGGGHGRVVLDALLTIHLQVTAILDPALKVGDDVFGVPILGDESFLNDLSPKEAWLVNGLGANPNTLNRQRKFEEMKAKGFDFPVVCHASAMTGRECDLKDGAQVMAGAVLQNRVCVNENAVINTRASIDHDCVIGAHAFVSPGAVLCGGVKVGTSAFVGSGAVLLPGIEIGINAVIGAGSVVTKSVPEGWIVAGNPAIKIGMKSGSLLERHCRLP